MQIPWMGVKSDTVKPGASTAVEGVLYVYIPSKWVSRDIPIKLYVYNWGKLM